jgi:hypothetical protein
MEQGVGLTPKLWPFSAVFTDNACKSGKYLQREGLLDGSDGLHFALNTFHAFGHRAQCAPLFSAMFAVAMGAFDGESAERAYARFLLTSRPTRVMKPAMRVAWLTHDALIYFASREMEHAKFLEHQCIFDARRLHFATLEYEKVLAAASLATGLVSLDLHRNVPLYTQSLLERNRQIENSSRGSSFTGMTADEDLRAQLGKCLVELLTLEGLLDLKNRRDERFVAQPVIVRALADFERSLLEKRFPRGLHAQLARAANLRSQVLVLRGRITDRGAQTIDADAVVAHMTATYRNNLQLVMTQLQVLIDLQLVRL